VDTNEDGERVIRIHGEANLTGQTIVVPATPPRPPSSSSPR
jgi:hypothetical protein